MAKIRALDERIIGRIAAGEVVERPEAAIKELIENSLDAGATSIQVETHADPTEYFRVSDNGSGIDPADVRLAFERHATSKIRDEKDLEAIATLGFRGEALASIAAVSRVTLTSRTADRDTGIRVTNEAGKIVNIEETACPVGTTVIVRDLFYNVPVRKGFLKKAKLEANYIVSRVAGMLLSRPDVAFRLDVGGTRIYQSVGDGKLLNAVMNVFGLQSARTMREVNGHEFGLMIHGYVGIGELARNSRNGEYFFINGRIMKSPLLSAAVENACTERVMIGRYPICCLHLRIAYDAVDVNVHPNKLEVRFRDEGQIRQAVTDLVTEALIDRDAFEKPLEMHLTGETSLPEEREDLSRSVRENEAEHPAPPARGTTVTMSAAIPADSFEEKVEKPEPVFREIPRDWRAADSRKETAFRPACVTPEHPPAVQGTLQTQNTVEVQEPGTSVMPPARGNAADEPLRFQLEEERAEQLRAVLPEPRKPLKIFGALFDTYIMIEYEDALLLIDQHAVHERLLFDRMLKELDQPHAGQELLVPPVVSMTREEQNLLEENREILEQIGLEVEPFGPAEVTIRTIPMILGEAQAVSFLRDIVGELENGKVPTAEKKRTAILQSACKHAVKGGEKLSEEELRSLAMEMIEKKVTPTCPHGRPLVVAVFRRELDKKFGRIQ